MAQLIATIEELTGSEPKKFKFMKGETVVECFALEYNGEIRAYRNQCRHQPIPLDIGGNGKIFNVERTQLSCRHHGAVYEPLTGLCVGGPCPDAYLKQIPIKIENGKVYLDR